MEVRKLGKTGLEVSVIGFGGIPIQRVSFEEAAVLVNKALDLGINFFDTARGYTDSEAKMGAVLRKRRSEAVIATKSMARTKEEMAADIRKSLETLGVDFIDLYQ
ncbi:MAG TPA: aldo/keto reductase, partial [Peptococcaceae bacterium]|nr:aldo/keto reductase [Peptococcaceae bacterium]